MTNETKAVASMVRSMDRIYRTSAPVERLAARARALEAVEASRHAAYPLAWLCGTGRLSSERERAILDMKPAKFAELAIAISDTLGSVSACADAWRVAAAKGSK